MSTQEITAAISGYFEAYARHDAAGCAACYAPDAWITSPWGPPVTGQEAIEAVHEAWFEEGERDKTYDILDLRVGDTLAVCLLRYDATVPTENGEVAVAGVSLNGFSKSESGRWLWTHTSLNELEDVG